MKYLFIIIIIFSIKMCIKYLNDKIIYMYQLFYFNTILICI